MRFTRQSPSPKEFVGSLVRALNGGAYYKSLFKFEPRDVWVGLFWAATDTEYEYAKDFVRSTYRWRADIFICPFPCCLIRFAVEFGTPKWKLGDMSNFNRGRDHTNMILNAHKPINMPADRTALTLAAMKAKKGTPC